jgi:hypothetical protein
MTARNYSASAVQQRLDAMGHAVRLAEQTLAAPATLDKIQAFTDRVFFMADEIYLWATLGAREVTSEMLDARRREREASNAHPVWCGCDEICARISEEIETKGSAS